MNVKMNTGKEQNTTWEQNKSIIQLFTCVCSINKGKEENATWEQNESIIQLFTCVC